MITRIEIDGFKSFVDFSLDLPPFLALVGPNSSGKSNLFDALEYLKQDMAGWESALLSARRGRPQELFHRVAKGRPIERFLISVDSFVPTEYGLLGIRASAGAVLEERVYQDRNDATIRDTAIHTPVAFSNALRVLRGEEMPDSWSVFRPIVDSGFAAFKQHGSIPDVAVRARLHEVEARLHELSSWRFVSPAPLRMRSRWPTADDGALDESGKNIAAVLGRLAGTEHFDDIIIDISSLIPGVAGLNVDLDEHRQEWSFDVIFDDEGAVPSTLLSDGTLRVLAILTMLHDPKSAGTLLIEEIETGLHPSRLKELLRRIRQRVSSTYEPDAQLRQVIVTSHSPVVVSELYGTAPDSLMFMDTVARVDPENERVSRVTRALPVRSSGERGTYVSPRQIRQYLGTVRGEER